MEFNNMRVKTVLDHSSCILYIGFFKNNDEEHFYTLSNNGQLKEWLLNPDGSIILLETCYLLRPGADYLDYIGYPPTENAKNGHNIIISALTVSDNLLFCGYEDGLVIVWRQERRDVVDLNIFKSFCICFLRSNSCAASKSRIAGKALIKIGISLPFILNFTVHAGSSKYQPYERRNSGSQFIYSSSGPNFPCLYKAYPFANSSGKSFRTCIRYVTFVNFSSKNAMLNSIAGTPAIE